MFVDASALTAILTDEDDARVLAGHLRAAQRRMTSPLAIWETTVAVARRLGLPLSDAREAVRDYLWLADITVMPLTRRSGTVHSMRSTATARAGIPRR